MVGRVEGLVITAAIIEIMIEMSGEMKDKMPSSEMRGKTEIETNV